MVRFFPAFQLLVLIGFLSSRSESLRFDLQSGHTKCISEDIKQNAMTVGKYHVVNPNEGQPLTDERKLIVRVTSATGNTYHYSDKVESGQFGFVAAEAGDFMACFWAPDHQPQVTLSVDFDWRTGVAAKDWSNVAKKGSVEAINLFEWFSGQKLIRKNVLFVELMWRNQCSFNIFQGSVARSQAQVNEGFGIEALKPIRLALISICDWRFIQEPCSF
ncbi:transmembrane emp24 domain-containing protein p24delta9-like isoform X1 [Cucumis melo]|uniref:Transmembrane emp24 domain-containing protein p24delta9-like isoform X1 n=1 Tax=Cucumis melo TaxID=3656 RepID=A0ABM3L5U0_CUCME|nr:transmembrane emp24 domain-containing protein p24delta9-like isoform X1 [Cucumis melo]